MVRTILTDKYAATTCRIYRPVPLNEPVPHHEKEKVKRPRYMIKQTKKMVEAYEKRATPRPESVVAEAVSAVRVSANPSNIRQIANDLRPPAAPEGYVLMEKSRLEAERRTLVGREDIAIEEAEEARGTAEEARGVAQEAMSVARDAAEAAIMNSIIHASRKQRLDAYKTYIEDLDIDRKEQGFLTNSQFRNLSKKEQTEELIEKMGTPEIVYDSIFD
jgi:type II secretory pathway component GspD/PulD (secretin)